MSDGRRTKIAQFVSLAVGLFSIGVSIVMAHSDIKSAYEWFNSFMGTCTWSTWWCIYSWFCF